MIRRSSFSSRVARSEEELAAQTTENVAVQIPVRAFLASVGGMQWPWSLWQPMASTETLGTTPKYPASSLPTLRTMLTGMPLLLVPLSMIFHGTE